MPRCQSCAAPLLPNTNKCRYCGTRNDIDLHNKKIVRAGHASKRNCPHCEKPMQTIGIELSDNQGDFMIERCEQCFGMFFDLGEVERLLTNSVSNAVDINRQLLENINAERYRQSNRKVKYIKCPVCQQFMRRINYGHRSGVVVDRCNAHGFWLDSGELIHLMEWKKAGGQLLHEQHKQTQERQKRYRKKTAPFQSPEISDIGNSFDVPDIVDIFMSFIKQ